MAEVIASPNPPDLQARLNALKLEIAYGLNCCQVGEIVSFDATKQTARVKLMVLRVLGTQTVPYPMLADCPVFVPSGGTGYFTTPIAAGDPCAVFFSDRDIDNWFTSGSQSEANSARAHDLSDGLVVVGFRNLAKLISNYSTTDTEQRNGTGIVGIGSDGLIRLKNSSGSFRTQLDSTLSHIDDLCSELNTLCTNLTAWVNTDSTTPNAGTVSAINSTKAAIATTRTNLQTDKANLDLIFKA